MVDDPEKSRVSGFGSGVFVYVVVNMKLTYFTSGAKMSKAVGTKLSGEGFRLPQLYFNLAFTVIELRILATCPSLSLHAIHIL